MNKKVLILSASPRKNGNSDTLCNELLRGAIEAGHETEKIFLRDKKINICTGCGTCFNAGKPCPQKDDAPEIIQKMIDADVIVMATPVYFYTMNGSLKTLIDRCCARYTEINHKEFYFIATMADNDKQAMERTFEGLRGFTLCLENAEEKGRIYGTGIWQSGEVNRTSLPAEAYKMGKNI